MAHEWRLLGIIHRIGQVADQHAADAPAGHLSNGERPSEDAHVRMHSHDDEILDAALAQKAVYLVAVVGEDVVLGDRNGGMLPGPGLLALHPPGLRPSP